MTDAPDQNSVAGLRGIGQPLEGTDATPADGVPPGTNVDAQGGDNEQQDALRAHAKAQGSDQPVIGGLDDTRASASDGSINDNGNL